jgi:hypothetical protein
MVNWITNHDPGIQMGLEIGPIPSVGSMTFIQKGGPTGPASTLICLADRS